MGNSSYSVGDRTLRAEKLNYSTKTAAEIFTQSSVGRAHDTMLPTNVSMRECRDSDTHPLTVPIQLYLDVTGSMGSIPMHMIRHGLPKLMGNLIQGGVADAALMFGAIGDHECDRYPLQIGQFESGDAELDLWLTRTYLESGGGGNAGESYLLAWYFASNHVDTDAFSKRGQKGYLFTVGDEPCLSNLPMSALKGIMGTTAMGQNTLTAAELLEAAQRANHVYHIHMEHGNRRLSDSWKQLLGDHVLTITSPEQLSTVIIDTVTRTLPSEISSPAAALESTDKPSETQEML